MDPHAKDMGKFVLLFLIEPRKIVIWLNIWWHKWKGPRLGPVY